MNIAVNNQQTLCRPALTPLRHLVRRFMAKIHHIAPADVWSEISILLTDDAGIAEVHDLHLGGREVTDVISYRYTPWPGQSGGGLTGELIINVERARSVGTRQRRKGGVEGWARELALYLAHGCDHLGGAEDNTEAGRRRMRRRELRWLAEPEAAEQWRHLIRG